MSPLKAIARLIQLVKEEKLPPQVLDKLLTKEGALKNIPMRHGTSWKFKEFTDEVPTYLAEDPRVAFHAARSQVSNLTPKGALPGPRRIITTVQNPQSTLTSNWDGSVKEMNALLARAEKEGHDYIDMPIAQDIWIDYPRSPHYATSLNPKNLIQVGDDVVPQNVRSLRQFHEWYD